jgi:peptidoglycan/LPS O-acetylase OafA/YrhL
VDLFFVLSGFLIGSRLLLEYRNNDSLDIKRFFIRRIFKIWPAYYAFVFACLCLDILERGVPFWPVRPQFIAALFHFQNYGLVFRAHLWSLSVEEHFYVLLPFLLVVVARFFKNLTVLPLIAGTIAVVCLALRIWVCCQQPFDAHTLWQTQYRLDALFFGVFLSYLFVFKHEKFMSYSKHRAGLLLTALLLLSPMVLLRLKTEPIVSSLGLTMLYVGYGLLLIAFMGISDAEQSTAARVLFSRPMRLVALLGTFSYGIYLTHLEFAHTLGEAIASSSLIKEWRPEARWLAGNIVYMTSGIIIGILMTKCIELPVLAFRNRMFPARVAAITKDCDQT